MQARKFQQRFVSFRAAVAEERAARSRALHDTPRKFALVGMAKEIADMYEFRGLTLHGGNPLRMTMTQRRDADTRGEIQITASRVIPYPHAASAHQRDRRASVVAQHELIVERGRGRLLERGSGCEGLRIHQMADWGMRIAK